jgi:hypothetical protein
MHCGAGMGILVLTQRTSSHIFHIAGYAQTETVEVALH